MIRNKIKEYLELLENITNNENQYYKELEVALLIFLRSDLFHFNNYITDSDIEEIGDLIDDYDSLLDIDKEELDTILCRGENEEIIENEEYLFYVQSKYDEYLQKTENRGMSYGELAYLQNLSKTQLEEFEKELDKEVLENGNN